MSIRLYNNSGGYIDLNSGGNGSTANTFTLPAETGTLLTTASTDVYPKGGPAFRAYHTGSSQSITNSVFTKIQFNAETFDTNSAYDSSTNYRFTPQVAGYYAISVAVYFGLPYNSDYRIAAIYKNGSVYSSGYGGATAGSAVTTDVVYLNGSTDYVEGYVYITTDGSIASSTTDAHFSGSLVRAA